MNNWEKKKRKYSKMYSLSIQILQYEFLGPILLDDWGPPMEKIVYLILSRDKDQFNIVYVDDCEKTENHSFFTQHERFECWVRESGTQKSIHLAILPMFDSTNDSRQNVVNKIMARYSASCNDDVGVSPKKPDYLVRVSKDLVDSSEKFNCPCCGSKMKSEKILEKSTVYRCTGCGMSDTKLNS